MYKYDDAIGFINNVEKKQILVCNKKMEHGLKSLLCGKITLIFF